MSDTTMTVMTARLTGGRVRAEQLAEWIKYGPAPLIIDVREAWEFACGAVPQAVNLPVSNPRHLVDHIPDEGLVILVCGDGVLSYEAGRMLEFCGFRNVVSLHGGMKEWGASRAALLAA